MVGNREENAMETRKRFRFYFVCNNKYECLYDGYFDTDEEMITFAQGLTVGLRNFRTTAETHVYLVDENGTEKLARIQR